MRTYLLIFVVLVSAGAALRIELDRRRATHDEAEMLTGGSVTRGRDNMVKYGCVACHVVPGFTGTNSHVGPPLDDFAYRTYVAGTAENTPENLVRFIRDPRAISPKSAMPNLGISEADARDLAAFVYSLR
jgi:cytochrome c